MLYRLYDSNLVSFTRKKDKKKGWYIYYWTFNIKRVQHLMDGLRKHKIERLRERLIREQASQFFGCPNKCIRLDFEQATEFEYKCPECGNLLSHEDNTQVIDKIKTSIQQLEKDFKKK